LYDELIVKSRHSFIINIHTCNVRAYEEQPVVQQGRHWGLWAAPFWGVKL